MISLGYLYKHVADCPEWLTAAHVADVYSLSGCVSKPFADYVDYWKHNGYWLFSSPDEITELANAASISLEGLKLFYYEAYELQFDEDEKAWEAFEPWSATEVVAPISKKLEGFDIASFTMDNIAECSPLSSWASAPKSLLPKLHTIFVQHSPFLRISALLKTLIAAILPALGVGRDRGFELGGNSNVWMDAAAAKVCGPGIARRSRVRNFDARNRCGLRGRLLAPSSDCAGGARNHGAIWRALLCQSW